MVDSQAIDGWAELAARVGTPEELAASAKESGALLRRRGVRSASDLLRLCFAYVLGRLSLRVLAAWAAQGGIADLSDVAALGRLKGAADWLGELVAERLARRYPEAALEDARLVAVDATMIAPPGDKRDYWLAHTVFDLGRLQLKSVEVTDRHAPERLSRGTVHEGEIRIADRGHASVDEFAKVQAAGADFLVRIAASHPRLLDANGRTLRQAALAREAGARGGLDRPVVAEAGKSGTRVAARLVVAPLPPAAAEKARRQVRRNATRRQSTPQPDTLEVAGCLMLITSLPAEDWPPERLVAAYRLRWQVELAFKRLKSVIGLEELRARDPALARMWINTALLVALLAEEDNPALEPEAPDSLP